MLRFGFLCVQKNNLLVNRECSDYKVRFCCAKERTPTWSPWSPWSKCTKTCGGGTKVRTRECEESNNGRTCVGNWPGEVKKNSQQTADCSMLPCGSKTIRNITWLFSQFLDALFCCNCCTEDYAWNPWGSWEKCLRTCGKDTTRRRRSCRPAEYGGKECPSRSKTELYIQDKDCKLPNCPEPGWTKWEKWSDCSLTCGIGTHKRKRGCIDFVDDKKPLDIKECKSLPDSSNAHIQIHLCTKKDNCPGNFNSSETI